MLSGNDGNSVRVDPESPSHVFTPVTRRKAHLVARVSAPLQERGFKPATTFVCDNFCKVRRLIEATRHKSRPVQGNWHDQTVRAEQLFSGPHHPGPHRFCKVATTRELQTVNEPARGPGMGRNGS